MRKTLLITSNFFPVEGGIGAYLGLYFDLPRNRVVVYAPQEGNYEEFDGESGVKTYRSLWMGPPRKWKRLLRYVFLPLEVLNIVRRERIEAIHLANIGAVPATLLIPLKFLRIPLLCFTHGVELFKTKKFFAKSFLEGSALIVANSNFTKEVSKKRYGIPGSKIIVFHPGFDPKLLKDRPPLDDLKRKYGTEGKFVILTVSRIVWRKGHETVLQALAQLKENGFKDFKYLIVGRGRRGMDVREVVSDLRLDKEVEFVGYVENESLPKFYQLCDVFVMVPRDIEGDYEGFGIVYLEASAFGKPVVGSKSGGVPDAVGDGRTGLLVEPNDADELADVLLRLVEDRELREKLGEAGLRRSKSFTWDKLAKRFLKILEAADF